MKIARSAGAQYGLLFGFTMWAVLLVLPHPAGARILWSVASAHLLWGAWLVWSRMRLPWAMTAMIMAATGLGVFAVAGVSPFHPESVRLLPLLACAAASGAAAVFMQVEARAHPAAWKAWRDHVATSSLADLLRGRHIPNLRY